MSISFSGLASGLDTSSWVTSLTQLRQAKITTLETQKTQIATAQATLQGIRSFFASFRSSIEKITDSKFKVANMDIFSKKIAEVSNSAVLSATAKSTAAEGSYEVKVNNVATQTQVKSGYRYKTTLVSTTQAKTSSYLSNIGIGYGTNPESGISVGDIEIFHDNVTSRISISSDETMSSFLDKLHNVGINADFDNNTGVFSIDVNVGDIRDIGNTNIISKLKISDINYGYTCNPLTIEESHEEYHQATNNTLLSELGVSAGTISIRTANGDYELTLDDDDTIGSLVAALRSEGIEATFNEGIFSITNAEILSDGTTGLIEHFGLSNPEIASQTQESEGLTYQNVYTQTSTAQLNSYLKDIDGVTLEEDQTINVKDADGNTSIITVGTSTTIGDMVGMMNDAGLTVSYNESTGVLRIDNGWIISGGTFDVESAFGLQYTGVPAIVTGSVLTVTTSTITGATGSTKLKNLSTAVTNGTIKVTDTTGTTHNVVIDNNNTINDFVAQIRGLGLGAEFNNSTGVLTLEGGSYTTDGLGENKSNILSVFFGQETLTPSAVNSATSTSQALREAVVNTYNATATTSLSQLGLTEGNYTATFSTGTTNVSIAIDGNTTMSGLVSALRAAGVDAAFNADTSSIEITDGTFVGVTGGNFASIMNFAETTTGRYATSDIVMAQTVTLGREMTSAGVVNHTVVGTTTISTTVPTTSPIVSTSDALTYLTITTTATGSTEGITIVSQSLSYNSILTTPTTQTSGTLTYESISGATTTTIGSTLTTPTLYDITTTSNQQTVGPLTYVSQSPGSTTTTTTGMTAVSGSIYVDITTPTSQTSSTLGYYSIENGSTSVTTTGQSVTGSTMYVNTTSAINQTSTISYVGTEYIGGSSTTTPTNITQSHTLTWETTTTTSSSTSTIKATDTTQINTIYMTATVTTSGSNVTTGTTSTLQSNTLKYTSTQTIRTTHTVETTTTQTINATGSYYAYNVTGSQLLLSRPRYYSSIEGMESMQLSDLGMTSSIGVITFQNGDKASFTASSTLGDVANALESHGYIVGYDERNRCLVLETVCENSYFIVGIDSTGGTGLAEVLGLDSAVFYTQGLKGTECRQIGQCFDLYASDLVTQSMNSNIYGDSFSLGLSNGSILNFDSGDTFLSIKNSLTAAGLSVTMYGDGVEITDNNALYNTISISFTADQTIAITDYKEDTDPGIVSVFDGMNVGYGKSFSYTASSTTVIPGTTTSIQTTYTTYTYTVSGSTPFHKLVGYGSNNYIYYNSGDTSHTITVGSYSTMSDITSALNSAGFTATFSHGVLSVTGDSTHYITGMSSRLRNLFQGTMGQAGEGVSYNTETIGGSTTTYLTTATSGTTLKELGLTHDAEIVNNLGQTIIVSNNCTLDEMLSTIYNKTPGGGNTIGTTALGVYTNGSQGSQLSQGIIQIGQSSDTNYLVYMDQDLQDILGIHIGEGYTYTTSYIAGGTECITHTATTSTTLGEMGLGAGDFYIVNEAGTTVTVNGSTNINSIVNALHNNADGGLGITSAEFNDGVLTIGDSSDPHYLWSISPELTRIIGINAGNGITYNIENHDGSSTSHTYSVEGSTTLGDLGLRSSGRIILSNGRTVNVDPTSNVQSVLTSLSNGPNNITASIENGVISIGNAGDLNWLSYVSPNLAVVLGIDAGEGISYETGTSTANSETTLAELGMQGSEAVIASNTQTITVSSSTSLGSLEALLESPSFGLSVDLEDGVFSIDPGATRYLKYMSPNLETVLGIEAGYGNSYNIDISMTGGDSNFVTASSGITMQQLGLNTDGYIVNGSGQTATIATTDSISTVITNLDSIGIYASLSADGKFTLGSDGDSEHVDFISQNVAAILGLSAGNGISYVTGSYLATEDVTLSQAGMTGQDAVIISNTGTVTIAASSSITELVDVLNDSPIGLNASFSDGVLTINPTEGHVLESLSPNLENLLSMQTGYGQTYSITINVTQPENHTYTMTATSTFDNIGLHNDAYIEISNGNTITVTAGDCLGSLTGKLRLEGVYANGSLDQGTMKVGGDTETYHNSITYMSPSLSYILGIEAGEGHSYITNSVTVSSTSTLENLGMSGSGVVQLDNYTFTIAQTATLGDLVNSLNAEGTGVTAALSDGSLSITPNEGHCIKSMSSNLSGILGITTGYDNSYSTSISGQSTETFTASSATTLGQLGLRQNCYITLDDGQSILVNKTDTIETFVNNLNIGNGTNEAPNGIYASFANGQLSIGGNLPPSVDLGGGNIATGSEVRYITSIPTSLAAVLGIEAGEGNSYNSSTQKINATTETVLSTLGMEEGSSGVIRTNTGDINILASDSIGSVMSALTAAGFTATFNDTTHKLSIAPTEGHYIESMSPALSTALKLEAGENISYHIVNGEIQSSLVTAQTDTSLETLGMNGSGVIITDNNTLTIEKTDTIQALINKLNSIEISAAYNTSTGIFSLGSTTDTHYVKGMSTNLASVLGNISIGENFTYQTGTQVETHEENTYTIQTIDASCTFGDIGINEQGLINLSNGQVVTVNSDTTISGFMSDMNSKGINVTLSNGIFNLTPQDGVYISSTSGSDVLTAMNIVGSTYSTNDLTLGNTKLKNLRDSDGNSLNISSGTIKAYKNGIVSNILIDNESTLDELASQLANYNIQMVYGSGNIGRIYFTSSGDSYLQSAPEGTNLLSALGTETWTAVQDTASQTLQYEVGSNIVIDGNTKIVDLKKADGTPAGVTTGKYKIKANNINYEGTITDSTSVDDFFTELSRYGITGSINSDGQITLNTANDNTYLVKANGEPGYSNIVDTVFSSWIFDDIYESSSMDVTNVSTEFMTSETLLKNIDQGTYQAGKFIVSSMQNGDSILELNENSTVGDFMAALSYHGFNSYIENGKLIVRNDGYTTLKNYTVPSQASNVISLLGLNTEPWEEPGYYTGSAQNATTYQTVLEAATRSTTLSNLRDADGNNLGITTGEYYVYSNGIRHTLNLNSTDITLDSFINTLAGYGINTIFDTQDGQSTLKLIGNGDSYVASSSEVGASNVITKLFGNDAPTTLYNYSGYEQTTELVSTTITATLGTSLSDYDNGDIKSEGTFAFTVDGNYSEINITSYETFGSLLEKFERAGVQASLVDGVLRLETGNKTFVLDNEHTTSNLIDNLNLHFSDNLGGFAASSDAVTQTTTTIEDRTLSVAKYADYDTQLGLLNISSGTISVYRNGAKKIISVDNTETFSQFRSKLQAAFGDVDIDFDNGKLRFFSTTDDVDVQVGSSNDTSNMSSICGFSKDPDGYVVSARELYKVNASSLITTEGLFRRGDVTEGTFIVGDDTFTITSETTIQNIIAQINSSEKANASAYWDSVDGKLVISARTTGASMVNVEAGTSNFTDILGLTSSEWNNDGSVNITRICLESQELGQNAKFSINGTSFSSASNVVTSDVSRIQGLTINLKSSSMGDTVVINVGKDVEAVTEAVGEFVESYNELVENVDAELSAGGVLKDQSTLKFIRQQIRNLLVNTFSGATTFRNLAALGISTSQGNTVGIDTSNAGIEFLYFDSEKFMEGYQKDPDAVKNMLVGSDETPGILIQIENIVENALATGSGYFSSADKSYSDKISSINEKIRKANQAIEAYKARLESKFQSMDMLISQMQNQYNSFLVN